MDEPEEVFDMIVMPNQQTPEIAHPSEQAFNFPPPPIPTQTPAILSRRFPSVHLVRSNQLNPSAFHKPVQRIGIVGFVSNQPSWLGLHKSMVNRGSHEGRFVRGSARY